MKWCVTFPEETIMVVRPSLIAICMGDKSAAYLLSVLLYRYSIRREHQDDAENLNELKSSEGGEPSQDTTYHIYRKQSQLVADMCGVITEKTLHDVAVPMLQLLGYLDIEEHLQCNRYTLHIDAVEAALAVYKNQRSTLETFLIEQLQLEKFLIDKNYFQSRLEKFLMTSADLEKPIAQLEKFLIDKKKFQLQLEKVLIQNRKISHCARGRKASPKAVSEGKSESPKSNKSNNKSNNKSIDTAANADTHTSFSSEEITEERMRAWAEANGFTLQPKEPTVQAVNHGKNIPSAIPTRARKPDVTDEENARIDQFLACMDKVAQEALEEHTQEKSDFTFRKTKKDRGTVREFLNGRPISEQQIRMVYLAMWKSKPGANGFQWRDNMSIAAFCRNYDTMLLRSASTDSATDRSNEAKRRAETDNKAQLEKMLARRNPQKEEKANVHQ